MRPTLLRITIALAILAGMAATPAVADPIAPTSLVPALTVYVDSLARGHAAAAACAGPNSPARDEAAWVQAKAVLVATLWANNFPADFVADAARRLEAPPGATAPDCSDPSLFGYLGPDAHDGWLKDVQRVVSALDLAPVEQPVEPAQWATIRGMIAGELPLQAREFVCLAAVAPSILPVVVHGWDEMIVKMGGKLVAAGIARPEIIAALGNAEANALWQPATADQFPALRKSCADDKTWSDRLYTLRDVGLGYAVEKLLPASEAAQ